MALVDLVMPKMGESIMEATILKWLKQPGEHVKMDEPVLEIATDKVDSEVPSTTEGILEEVLFKVNDIVPVGTVIARIKVSAAEPVTISSTPVTADSHTQHHYTGPSSYTNSEPATSNGTSRFFSPLVL